MPKTNQGPSETSKPVHVFRLKGVKVAVFENRTTDGQGLFFKCSLQRIYRDGAEFKTTTSLNRDDLPVARHLLHKAWEWILEREAVQSKTEE